MLIQIRRHKRPLLIAVTVVLLLSAWLGSRSAEPSFALVTWLTAGYQVDERYLGVAIDAAMMTGGEWWSESDSPTLPLQLDHPQLLHWTKLLAPAWVRLGGTEADKLWLYEPGDLVRASSQLTHDDIRRFLVFTEQVGAQPFITASNGPLTRKENQWQSEQFQRLLNWLPPDYSGVLEWGNEPGAHWLFFGRSHQVRFDQLADEYQQAQHLAATQGIPLLGPANAFWPGIGEPLKQIVGSSKDFLQAGANPDVFTWHYYPTQSQRCGVRTEGVNWESLLDDEAMTEFAKQSNQINRWLKQYSPGTPKWLGETGPAQCGGRANFTDRFGSSLWWLGHLGEAARTGNRVVIRQSLVGGDYALLGYQQGSYSPNPDFWASKFWRMQMGAKGVTVLNSHRQLRAYAHCHPTKQGILSLVLVNTSRQPLDITLASLANARFFDVTSLDLDSRFVFLEGKLAELYDWGQADPLPWQPDTAWHALPAYAYRWVELNEPTLCGD